MNILNCDKTITVIATCLWLSTTLLESSAQTATVREEIRVLKTYPFNDPNPIPVLTQNPKIYPYFRFDGYSHDPMNKEWKVVVLENDFIQVFVLPEVGGKVWGAIEKSTGEEFIYRNEVMKFRNIAMRGPWTSGGIEFNFGIIGHTPSTATPVNYLTRKNDDGSVTCVVGNMDIPSRTFWRVLITLPKDKAYFETKVVWYNPTPLNQSYYNWMTGAAATGDDLEFFIPGDKYITHPGEAKSWPYDGERKISMYRNNNYGPSKSYHVVGEYNDFFGGYFHDIDFGFGHWSSYEEMPGQKLWLWDLSRSGGIWEDLLTDTDGQYIEFQAGRQFNQYSPGDHVNPISKVPFSPHQTDIWSELWFPVKQVGGMTEVSPYGILHVQSTGDDTMIGINALQSISGTLSIKLDNKTLIEEALSLDAVGVLEKQISGTQGLPLSIDIDEMDLHYSSTSTKELIKRPFTTIDTYDPSASQAMYYEGMELVEDRDFELGQAQFDQALKVDPYHKPTLLASAELDFRNALYQDAIKKVNTVLMQDTYHPEANFRAGIIYRALDDQVNALESLGWAARSLEFRSAAYAQMAEIYLIRKQFDLANKYSIKSLDYNRYNISALQAHAVAGRKGGKPDIHNQAVSALLQIDPLNHFARFEKYMILRDSSTRSQFTSHIRNELPEHSYLETALVYYNLELYDEARELFTMSSSTVGTLYLAYLSRTNADTSGEYLNEVLKSKPDFVFPFRRETIPILEWAITQNDDWKLKYYLALVLWNKSQQAKALDLMEQCNNTPDYFAFYLTRAELRQKLFKEGGLNDIKAGVRLAPTSWRAQDQLIDFYHSSGQQVGALDASKKAYKSFPGNNSIGLKHVRALLYNNNAQQAISILHKLNVLPFEGASEGRQLYENAHLMHAADLINSNKYKKAIEILKKAKIWPESLGVGKPYNPDERGIDYLLGLAHKRGGDRSKATRFFRSTVEQSHRINHPSLIAQLLAAKELNDSEKLEKLENAGQSNAGTMAKWALAKYKGENGPKFDKGTEDLKVRIFLDVISE